MEQEAEALGLEPLGGEFAPSARAGSRRAVALPAGRREASPRWNLRGQSKCGRRPDREMGGWRGLFQPAQAGRRLADEIWLLQVHLRFPYHQLGAQQKSNSGGDWEHSEGVRTGGATTLGSAGAKKIGSGCGFWAGCGWVGAAPFFPWPRAKVP